VRYRAVALLGGKSTAAAQELLATALDDDDEQVRTTALSAIIAKHAQEGLLAAFSSRHADVRVKAGRALARSGDAAALAPLMAFASAPRPEKHEEEATARWKQLVLSSLAGLAELGDPSATEQAAKLLEDTDEEIRVEAVQTLIWTSREDDLAALKQARSHADERVKVCAELGLAIQGGEVAGSLPAIDHSAIVVLPTEAGSASVAGGSFQRRTALAGLAATLTVPETGRDRLYSCLDVGDPLRSLAHTIVLLLEAAAPSDAPEGCLAAIASRAPRLRLLAAEALLEFGDTATFSEFVVNHFNSRSEGADWTISAETVTTYAAILAFAPNYVKARAVFLLPSLLANEQEPWDQSWNVFHERYADTIVAANAAAEAHKAAKSHYSNDELTELAVGAYVGLIREQGGFQSGSRGKFGRQIADVRQTALDRLLALAQNEKGVRETAIPVFTQALGDPNQDVRMRAFDHLQTLKVDNAELGAEALQVGHTDLGVRGLKALTEGASKTKARDVLQTVMLNRTDELAVESAKLLAEDIGEVKTAAAALTAVYPRMRHVAVAMLDQKYDEEKAAQKALVDALKSRYESLQERAVVVLARKKDKAAFAAIVRLLSDADLGQQVARIQDFLELGDPRAADALMDRLENDPAGNANVNNLLTAAGSFRNVDNADRLLGLMENSKWRRAAGDAVLTISGFDQPLPDGTLDADGSPQDLSWEEKQHPRHGALLAKLMERYLQYSDRKALAALVMPSAWAKTDEVDEILATLSANPDDGLRNNAIEVISWRLRHRNGDVEPLLNALDHKDGKTKLAAAVGLAWAQRDEGLSILQSAIELMPDVRDRIRAVESLGKLGDQRGLDVLLQLANNVGHALQESAAEALGHMGKSEKAEEIFELLKTFADNNDGIAVYALRGLRWFNTPAAWRLIRSKVFDPSFYYTEEMLKLLAHNDEPATRDLVLKFMSEAYLDWDEHPIFETARTLFGAESLEPDYAILQNTNSNWDYDPLDFEKQALRRVCEQGDAERMLATLPKCGDYVQQQMTTSLMQREDLPLDAVANVLTAEQPRTVAAAAHILGRCQGDSQKKALAAAVTTWRERWFERESATMIHSKEDDKLAAMTACLKRLLWACGRLGETGDAVLAAADNENDKPLYRPIAQAALVALAEGKPSAKALDCLQTAAECAVADTRLTATSYLATVEPKRAVAIAAEKTTDRVGFYRLAQAGVDLVKIASGAVSEVHSQGVVIPMLAKSGELKALADVAVNEKLTENARLGAIEGIGALASEAAEEQLAEIGSNSSEEEELRKAAWRARRRSQRARAN